MASPSALDRRPPELLFVISGISLYLGAAVAVLVFDQVGPATTAWLRVGFAGVLLSGVRRVWRRGWTRRDLALAVVFGSVLAVMNLCFYLAADSLHLGTAVAVEFIGPIGVAAVTARSARSAGSIALAALGVALLADVRLEAAGRGFVFALLAAGCWAGYIVLGSRLARSGPAVDGLGLGMLAGAVVIAPFGAPGFADALDAPWVLIATIAVAVLSSIVPYGLDQVVLRRVSPGRFALLLALLPVTASAMGFVVLEQRPGGTEALGIGLVVLALAVRDRAPL